MIKQIMFVALGGAIGSVLRYLSSTLLTQIIGRGFPWGTLAVNVLGSLLMGFLFVKFVEHRTLSTEMRAMWMVGLLGAFTTYSTFSIETLSLIETGMLQKAVLNIFFSVCFCLLAAWCGVQLARHLG